MCNLKILLKEYPNMYLYPEQWLTFNNANTIREIFHLNFKYWYLVPPHFRKFKKTIEGL
jgi:hypothetical protein